MKWPFLCRFNVENTWCVCRINFIITRFLNLVYENVEKKEKEFKHSNASHSKKPCREKAQNFTVGINITPSNYSFMSGNCFSLLFYTQLMSNTSYWSQQNILSGHRQSLSDASSVFFFVLQFSLQYFNSMKMYIVMIYDIWVSCTNIYLHIHW